MGSRALYTGLVLSLFTMGIGVTVVSAQTKPFNRDDNAALSSPWSLVFSDEFESPELNGAKWVTCYWWADTGCTNSGNKELQLYQPDGVKVTKGALHLQASHAAMWGPKNRFYTYQSGMVTTARSYSEKGKPLRFSFQYGYAEIKAKMPRGKGLWPAFWLLPQTLKSRPEIDIMEMLGDSPHLLRMHVHRLDDRGAAKSEGETKKVDDLSQGWHRFGLLWEKDELVWFLDGKEQWRLSDAAKIPDEPLYILLNLAVGGEWPGAPDKTTRFPAEFVIDYVRVWQRP